VRRPSFRNEWRTLAGMNHTPHRRGMCRGFVTVATFWRQSVEDWQHFDSTFEEA
jgi:hypothetical protein